MKIQIQKSWLVLMMAALFWGCSTVQTVKLINSGEIVVSDSSEITVPFDWRETHILTKVRLNGDQKEYQFLFDTGALTLIRQETALELGLRKELNVQAADSGGEFKTIDLVKLDRIAVGNMAVRDCAAGVTDFSEVFPPDITGILGSNFLKHFIVTIDYQRHQITLSQNKTDLNQIEKSFVMPFETDMRDGFAPGIKCTIEGSIKSTAIIDTGFSGTLSLPADIIKKTGSYQNGNYISSSGNMSGGMFSMSGENVSLRLGEFKMGERKLENLPCESHSTKSHKFLLGNKFLDKFSVTLNYPAKEMTLTPNGVPMDDNIQSYGLALGKKDDKTVVTGMWEGSSASRNGLKLGDEVIKINGQDVDPLSLFELMLLFSQDGSAILTIEYINEAGKQTAALTKTNLLP